MDLPTTLTKTHTAMRGPGESYSDVILRLVGGL
jgi:predicted CopG family antitoxin